MPSLQDHIDRFANTSKAIRASTNHFTSTPAGPFARAVLQKPLSDLIREIDVAELGLFSLVQPSPAYVDAPVREAVTRTEIPSATPLRKPTKREIRPDPEPEVYAEAALRYLDRYQDLRPMPDAREKVIEIRKKLGAMRENMSDLRDGLQQPSADAGPSSKPLKVQADDEDRRIKDIQSRISKLKKRKEALLKGDMVPEESPSSTPSSFRKTPKAAQSPDRDAEDEFWMTPGPSSRKAGLSFQDKDNLLVDEEIGDVSMGSLASPIPPPRTKSKTFSLPPQADPSPRPSPKAALDEPYPESPGAGDNSANDDFNEKTVVLPKAPLAQDPPSSSSLPAGTPSREPLTPINQAAPLATPQNGSTRVGATPASSAKKRLRVNSEMERIVAKIWSTIGEVIMPGHPFDVSGKTSNKPPRAKETISHLEQLAASEPSPTPSSPTTSTISYTATTPTYPIDGDCDAARPVTLTLQQILTAHMLLVLLASMPRHSLPLNKLKLALAERGGTGSSGTRVLYSCVAKKLVRIERGGGEQVVCFDV